MENTRFKSFAQSLFTKHETRMWRKEKDIFLNYCRTEFKALGYHDSEITIREDRNMLGFKSRNLLIGPPDADILITAHYDTPGRNGFLLLLAPVFGILLGSMTLMFPLFFGVGFLTGLLGLSEGSLLASFLPLLLLIAIPSLIKNPHNHTDNTSGVLGVFNLAARIAENPELRKKCAFVLFDHEEVLPGLLGSKAFAKWRKRNHPDKVQGKVINLDCIGTGDVLTVMAKKKHRGQNDIAAFLQKEGFPVKKVRSGLTGNSDHAVFPRGVSLLYQKRSLLGPLYIPKIHSGRDTVCDLDQVDRLCGVVYQYIENAAP